MASFIDGVPGLQIALEAGDADESFPLVIGEDPGPDALRLGTPQLGDATGYVRAGIAVGAPSELPGLPALPDVSDLPAILEALPALPALPDISPEAIADATVTVSQLIGDVTVNVLPGV